MRYKKDSVKTDLDVSSLVEVTVGILADTLKGKDINRVFTALSGGKDSIVATHIAAKHLGVTQSVMETSFFFPRYMRQMPAIAKTLGVTVSYYERLTLEWLKRNQKHVFGDGKSLSQYYSLRQQRTIKLHFLNNKMDAVITGRRNQENSVRAVAYTTNEGVYSIHPLREWGLDHVWSYIYQNDLPYPDIYETEFGRIEGASGWPTVERETWKSIGKNFLDGIFDYDPTPLFAVRTWREDINTYLLKRGL